jgi:hypothetical protein
MSLSEIILFPLTHSVVSNASLVATAQIIAAYRLPQLAPVKSKRTCVRKTVV